MQAGIHLEIESGINSLSNRLSHNSAAMPPHQSAISATKRLGQVASHGNIRNQQIRIPKDFSGIPHRYFVSDCSRTVHHWPQFLLSKSERYDAAAVIVDHRLDVWPRLVQPAMYEPLQIPFASAGIDGYTFERKLHDVVGVDELGRYRSGEKKAVRFLWVPRAYMSKCIHDSLSS